MVPFVLLVVSFRFSEYGPGFGQEFHERAGFFPMPENGTIEYRPNLVMATLLHSIWITFE
jgi:hypothetical protein